MGRLWCFLRKFVGEGTDLSVKEAWSLLALGHDTSTTVEGTAIWKDWRMDSNLYKHYTPLFSRHSMGRDIAPMGSSMAFRGGAL